MGCCPVHVPLGLSERKSLAKRLVNTLEDAFDDEETNIREQLEGNVGLQIVGRLLVIVAPVALLRW